MSSDAMKGGHMHMHDTRMDPTERELFGRSVRQATGSASGAALDAALADLGWRDALGVYPRDAVSLLFGAQGEACATSSALQWLVLDALELGAAAPGAAVLPALGGAVAPGELIDKGLSVHGLGTAASVEDDIVVVARSGKRHVASAVSVTALDGRAVGGLDPDLALVELRCNGIAVDGIAVDGGLSGQLGDDVEWSEGVRLARLALGHELVGLSRQMLTLAREHALERVQFDRPIAMFQAVRHRLAETLVAIETAEAMLDAAWDDGSSVSAAMAKSLAGRGARTAARHCQQVLAGIGFTTEHPLHLYIRRAWVLDELFGSARVLTRELGESLLAGGELPPVQAL